MVREKSGVQYLPRLGEFSPSAMTEINKVVLFHDPMPKVNKRQEKSSEVKLPSGKDAQKTSLTCACLLVHTSVNKFYSLTYRAKDKHTTEAWKRQRYVRDKTETRHEKSGKRRASFLDVSLSFLSGTLA